VKLQGKGKGYKERRGGEGKRKQEGKGRKGKGRTGKGRK